MQVERCKLGVPGKPLEGVRGGGGGVKDKGHGLLDTYGRRKTNERGQSLKV